MALSGSGREEWPPGLVTVSSKFCDAFSPIRTARVSFLPSGPSRPPPPSLRPKSACTRSGRFFASQEAPLNASLVSSPQVSAILRVRFGGLAACFSRIMASTQVASSAFMSAAPRA